MALGRIEQARIANEESDWFVAAAEAILWLMLADELNWNATGYVEHRDRGDPRGPALLGFRYLWNLIKHYPIIEVIDFESGAGWPWKFPVVWQEAHWKRREDLPELDAKYRQRPSTRAQAAAYDAWLAGRLLKVTIPAAATFFDCRPPAYG